MKRFATLVAAAGLVATCVGSAHADIIAFNVGGASQQYPSAVTPPASAPWGPSGYPGDTVAFLAHGGNLDTAAGLSQILKVNTLSWTIDYTYGGTATDPDDWSDLQFAVAAVRNMTVGAAVGAISQTGTLDVTWENDFLTLLGGPTSTFVVPGFQIDVTPLGIIRTGGTNFSGDNPWTQPQMDVMARFDVTVVDPPQVPEPAAISLIALAVLALARRRPRP